MSKTSRRPQNRAARPSAPRKNTKTQNALPAPSGQIVLPPRMRGVLLAALIAVVTGLVFSSVLHADFIDLDDDIHIYANPYLSPATFANVLHFWTHPYQYLYVPLAYTTFAGLTVLARMPSHDVSGLGTMTLNAHVFHGANLLLHCANAVLVFVLLRRLVRQDGAAVAGALLFALHPLQTESVAWVSELRGVLSAFFSLWALLLFGRRNVIATLCFVLAVLCKPAAVCVPLIAWAIAHWGQGEPTRACLRRLWPWLSVSIVAAVLTSHVQPVGQAVAVPLWQRPFVAGDALAFYLQKLFWPTDLCVDYGRMPGWVLAHRVTLIRWLVPAAVAVLTWWAGRRAPILWASGSVFIVALLPVLGFTPFVFQYYSTVADRYMYLPMLGPAIAVAWMLSRLSAGRPALLGGVASAAILLLLALQSTVQAQYWNDTSALMRRTVEVNPRSWMAHNNLASFFMKLNQLQDAQDNLDAAIRIDPLASYPHANKGSLLQSQGHFKEAIAEYRVALQRRPSDSLSHSGLAQCFDALHQTNEAVAEYRIAAQMMPRNADAHNLLGVDLEMLGQNDEALTHFQEAVRLMPLNSGFHLNLGKALQAAGRTTDAVTQFREAVRLDPANKEAQQVLAEALRGVPSAQH